MSRGGGEGGGGGGLRHSGERPQRLVPHGGTPSGHAPTGSELRVRPGRTEPHAGPLRACRPIPSPAPSRRNWILAFWPRFRAAAAEICAEKSPTASTASRSLCAPRHGSSARIVAPPRALSTCIAGFPSVRRRRIGTSPPYAVAAPAQPARSLRHPFPRRLDFAHDHAQIPTGRVIARCLPQQVPQLGQRVRQRRSDNAALFDDFPHSCAFQYSTDDLLVTRILSCCRRRGRMGAAAGRCGPYGGSGRVVGHACAHGHTRAGSRVPHRINPPLAATAVWGSGGEAQTRKATGKVRP